MLAGFVNAQTEQVPSPLPKAEPPKFQTWYKVPEDQRPKIPGRLVNFVMDHPNAPIKGSIYYNADFSQRALAYENPKDQPEGFGVWFCADVVRPDVRFRLKSNPNRVMFLRDSKANDYLFYVYDASAKWGSVVYRYSEPFLTKTENVYTFNIALASSVKSYTFMFDTKEIIFSFLDPSSEMIHLRDIKKNMTRENCKDY